MTSSRRALTARASSWRPNERGEGRGGAAARYRSRMNAGRAGRASLERSTLMKRDKQADGRGGGVDLSARGLGVRRRGARPRGGGGRRRDRAARLGARGRGTADRVADRGAPKPWLRRGARRSRPSARWGGGWRVSTADANDAPIVYFDVTHDEGDAAPRVHVLYGRGGPTRCSPASTGAARTPSGPRRDRRSTSTRPTTAPRCGRSSSPRRSAPTSGAVD